MDAEPGTAFGPRRWSQLAAGVGLAPHAPLVLALSGGADSVYLLHVLAAARPRPAVLCVHVDHGLRGSESRADAEFCRALARELGLECVVEAVELDRRAGDLEQRARIARYRALCGAAERHGATTIATGHHADDSLETLLLRWTRGSALGGFRGVPARTELPPLARPDASGDELNPTAHWMRIVRPLHALRREEVRESLRGAGRAWRDDSSNASALFSRNRVRHALLPVLRAACSHEEIESLFDFARSVEELEDACARRTAAVCWGPPRFAAARRAAHQVDLGGSLERARLAVLPEPLLRRALGRLIAEGTGRYPRRAARDRLVALFVSGRTGETSLTGGWRIVLRSDWIDLDPPRAADAIEPETTARETRAPSVLADQLELPFDAPPGAGDDARPRPAVESDRRPGADPLRFPLAIPGRTQLPDGRILNAEFVTLPPGADVPRTRDCVELDGEGLPDRISVRWPEPGDRFHPLGAPGSRPLTRFLRDAGIPRHDRGRIALVCAGDELLWVAGVRPSEARRVGPRTHLRLRLSLGAAEAPRER